jgi:hypothetical protein
MPTATKKLESVLGFFLAAIILVIIFVAFMRFRQHKRNDASKPIEKLTEPTSDKQTAEVEAPQVIAPTESIVEDQESSMPTGEIEVPTRSNVELPKEIVSEDRYSLLRKKWKRRRQLM